ncbi:helix-turn-helix transcriptional regulator [uncultured Tateyamaria sp.]|uniref:helix-turn-helix domain-containing protein n=1 Tax=uncultured Tateyamaria sp. TaxID=455651 RepID=UPI00261B2F33|nr:helix-turn-helix transcriptional regulator [uncultured Tateyamaria sp.]
MERKNEKLIRAFAKVLKDRRKAVGLSQEELAFRADLSTSYVSLLETRNRQPTLTVMDALARQLDLTLAELVRLVESDMVS